jgi:hypothetical protein
MHTNLTVKKWCTILHALQESANYDKQYRVQLGSANQTHACRVRTRPFTDLQQLLHVMGGVSWAHKLSSHRPLSCLNGFDAHICSDCLPVHSQPQQAPHVHGQAAMSMADSVIVGPAVQQQARLEQYTGHSATVHRHIVLHDGGMQLSATHQLTCAASCTQPHPSLTPCPNVNTSKLACPNAKAAHPAYISHSLASTHIRGATIRRRLLLQFGAPRICCTSAGEPAGFDPSHPCTRHSCM